MNRSSEIVARLSLEQKIALLDGQDHWHTTSVGSVPAMHVSDGPHGIGAHSSADTLTLDGVAPAVGFPTASALASSWDKDLARRQGTAIGREARRLGVDIVLGPGVNIKRTPLCGRNFEYFSEDPHLGGHLAAQLIQGVQQEGPGTAVKHFAANNQEFDRQVTDAIVDERALREIYLKSFEIAVREGVPTAVMAAYNALNGASASENPYLLTDVLRDDWGFEGLVMSDWGAIRDRAVALQAGLDLEMPANELGSARIREALASGELDEAVIDRACERIISVALRVTAAGHLDPRTDNSDVRSTAADIARECIVLLRNENGILPLTSDGSGTIGVIGSFAETPRIQGGGSSGVITAPPEGALTALAEAFGERLRFAPGYIDDGTTDDMIADARSVAEASDLVILFVGLTTLLESEGYDRDDLELPAAHRRLIDEVLSVNPNVVLVLQKGAPVNLTPWIKKVPAIVDVGLNGEGSGVATADVLLGRVNPSGRLAETVPERLEDTPAYLSYPGAQGRSVYSESIFVGYRYYDKKKMPVSYPFGYGLSYTTFEYSDLEVAVDERGDITGSVIIRNTGDRAGKEVVQVYLADLESTVPRPVHELKFFSKLALDAGESRRVPFTLSRDDFAFWDEARAEWTVENGAFEIRVGSSSRDIHLTHTVLVDTGIATAEPLTRETPARVFLATQAGRDLILPIAHAIPIFGDIQALPPFARKIIDEIINGMPIHRFVEFSGGRLSDDQVDDLITLLSQPSAAASASAA